MERVVRQQEGVIWRKGKDPVQVEGGRGWGGGDERKNLSEESLQVVGVGEVEHDVLVDGGLARVHLAQQDMASADLRHSHAVDLHADAVAVQRRVYLLDVRQTCARQLRKLSVYLYIEWSDVAASMVTIRSPFCGYNTIYCVELNGEDLSCYSNTIESVTLRKCPYDHWLQTKRFKRYHNDKHFPEFLPTRWRQKSTGIDMEQNYVTVILSI